jgi:ankyrin repeat protein
MKRRLYITIFVFAVCSFLLGPQRSSQALPRREQQRNFIKIENLDKFQELVRTKAQQYAHSPEMFLRFLNTPTQEGVPPLSYAAAVSGDENIVFMINKAKQVFNGNKDLFLRFINAPDVDGHTALYWASETGRFSTIQTLLNNVASSVLGSDKKLFLKFLTASADDKWTPLHNLTYASDSDAMKAMVYKARDMLDPDSEEYNQFINYVEKSGGTPLSYALDPSDRLFLINNGATITQPFGIEERTAMSLGDKLIEAVKDDNFEEFKRILRRIQEQYKNNKEYFVDAISQRDADGWNALMHAVAHNKISFIEDYVNVVGKVLKNNIEDIYDVLSNKSKDGENVLIIAISRRYFKAASIILDLIKRYAKNKLFYYMFMNEPEDTNGFSPLLAAVYNSASGGDEEEFYAIIKEMIEDMNERFGGTHAFYHFINVTDYNGNTALAFATIPKLRQLLIRYGAIDPKTTRRALLLHPTE